MRRVRLEVCPLLALYTAVLISADQARARQAVPENAGRRTMAGMRLANGESITAYRF